MDTDQITYHPSKVLPWQVEFNEKFYYFKSKDGAIIGLRLLQHAANVLTKHDGESPSKQ